VEQVAEADLEVVGVVVILEVVEEEVDKLADTAVEVEEDTAVEVDTAVVEEAMLVAVAANIRIQARS